MPSGQRWPLSQNANKASGTCSVCFQQHQLHMRGNTVHLHGPRSNPCSGSNKPPLDASQGANNMGSQLQSPGGSSSSQSAALVVTSQSSSDVSNPVNATAAVPLSSASASTPAPTAGRISHPVSIPVIKHFPKSARTVCCTALTALLTKVTSNPEDVDAWTNLFNFCPTVLNLARKAGSHLSVTATIKARISQPAAVATDTVYKAARTHRKEFALSAAVSTKIEDGNIKAALRLLCSEDKPADCSDTVFTSMQDKHPPAASDRKPVPAPSSYTPLQVSESVVLQAVRSFPAGSSGGPDGFRPQHLSDLISCKVGGSALLVAVTGFVNLILAGGCPTSICPVFFGARLIAIEKKSGGVRPSLSAIHLDA